MASNNSKTVLVIYTGGTLGMKWEHDKGYTAHGLIEELNKNPNILCSTKDADERHFSIQFSIKNHNKTIKYYFEEFRPVLDSSNMSYPDWKKFAQRIYQDYDSFDGFVILQGTDTMVCTASALSFMLENLGKCVVLTGSQLPIYVPHSDARVNVLNALVVAGYSNIPEVLICFDSKVFRGNRCVKTDSVGFSAYCTPHEQPLIVMEADFTFENFPADRPKVNCESQIFTDMCTDVGMLRLYPGLTEETFKAFMNSGLIGVVLLTYGSGNVPDALSDWIKESHNWMKTRLLAVNVSQCQRGVVREDYASALSKCARKATSGVLRENHEELLIGDERMGIYVTSGADMTPEAAMMKLSYVLGKYSGDFKKQKAELIKVLRNEITNRN